MGSSNRKQTGATLNHEVASEQSETGVNGTNYTLIRSTPPQWFRIDEAAAYSTMSERELTRAIELGHLKVYYRGRRLIIHREDLDSWLKSG